MQYKIDKDGNTVDMFGNAFEKLEKIKEQMETELKVIKMRYDKNEKSMYPRKLNDNGRITSRFFIICGRFEKIPYEYAISIDLKTMKQYSQAFLDLWTWILDYYPDFVCNKDLFVAFLGISQSAYSYLLTNCQDPEILAEIHSLHMATGVVETVSAQTGLSKEKTTITKLGADSSGIGYGMKLNQVPEVANVHNHLHLESADKVKKDIEKILGFSLIENKGKK